MCKYENCAAANSALSFFAAANLVDDRGLKLHSRRLALKSSLENSADQRRNISRFWKRENISSLNHRCSALLITGTSAQNVGSSLLKLLSILTRNIPPCRSELFFEFGNSLTLNYAACKFADPFLLLGPLNYSRSWKETSLLFSATLFYI